MIKKLRNKNMRKNWGFKWKRTVRESMSSQLRRECRKQRKMELLLFLQEKFWELETWLCQTKDLRNWERCLLRTAISRILYEIISQLWRSLSKPTFSQIIKPRLMLERSKRKSGDKILSFKCRNKKVRW